MYATAFYRFKIAVHDSDACELNVCDAAPSHKLPTCCKLLTALPPSAPGVTSHPLRSRGRSPIAGNHTTASACTSTICCATLPRRTSLAADLAFHVITVVHKEANFARTMAPTCKSLTAPMSSLARAFLLTALQGCHEADIAHELLSSARQRAAPKHSPAMLAIRSTRERSSRSTAPHTGSGGSQVARSPAVVVDRHWEAR